MNLRDFLTGNRASVVQVDRLARYLWNTESGYFVDWNKGITEYRRRAKEILTTGDGWKDERSYPNV